MSHHRRRTADVRGLGNEAQAAHADDGMLARQRSTQTVHIYCNREKTRALRRFPFASITVNDSERQ
jgi:hypothetical protein